MKLSRDDLITSSLRSFEDSDLRSLPRSRREITSGKFHETQTRISTQKLTPVPRFVYPMIYTPCPSFDKNFNCYISIYQFGKLIPPESPMEFVEHAAVRKSRLRKKKQGSGNCDRGGNNMGQTSPGLDFTAVPYGRKPFKSAVICR